MKQKHLNTTVKDVGVSAGQSVQIVRALQGVSVVELSNTTGISCQTLSAIEADQVALDKKQAKALARALKCKPESFLS